MQKSEINICRPGYGASCALCCGSHNYSSRYEEIEALFNRRSALMKNYDRAYLIRNMTAGRSNMTGSYNYKHPFDDFTLTLPVIFEDCPQCPFVGYTGETRIVGCLLHPVDRDMGMRHECFISYRGKVYSCRSRQILHDDEIRYAARITGDWYYYSILIHEPDLLRGLMQEHPVAETVQKARQERMKGELEERTKSRRELHMIHSYFS